MKLKGVLTEVDVKDEGKSRTLASAGPSRCKGWSRGRGGEGAGEQELSASPRRSHCERDVSVVWQYTRFQWLMAGDGWRWLAMGAILMCQGGIEIVDPCYME